MNCSTEIIVGARGSTLSRVQCDEVLEELKRFHPHSVFHPIWVETTGDKDLKTSLRSLEKTDFFTKEIDALQLSKGCRISIHSAKDLPEPLPRGLVLAALTQGVDPYDSLVLRDGETLEKLPLKARIGTSSVRREKNIHRLRANCKIPRPRKIALLSHFVAPPPSPTLLSMSLAAERQNGSKGRFFWGGEFCNWLLRSDLVCVDIRGTIQTRLSLLDQNVVDGLIIAEAALIRLKLTHLNRIFLPGECAPLQGQLAVIVREDDEEMLKLFQCIDSRQK